VQFVDDRGRQTASRIARAVEIEARRIETKFSRYRDTSVVSEINRNAGRTPVAVDGETDDLVRCALEFKAGKVPTGDEIDALRPLVDASAVSRRERTVFLRRAGMEIDLGGVGKEYAVDRAARLLREEGVRSAVVSFSGDVRTIGSRGDGRPWKVGVVDPRNRNRCRFAVRPLSDAGIATSGDYERGFVKDGVRYHHILDARTGWPARGVASVTVVAATAFRAGCYATASFLLGPAAGLTLLENAEDVEGALITDEGEILATSGMWLLSDLPGGVWEGCREA